LIYAIGARVIPNPTIEAATEHSLATAEPVSEKERILTLDVLRGFALLGILLMNIQDISMPGAAYMNPTAYGDLHGAKLAPINVALSYTLVPPK